MVLTTSMKSLNGMGSLAETAKVAGCSETHTAAASALHSLHTAAKAGQ